jgi:beta-lactam-binding protein with PASTA domain
MGEKSAAPSPDETASVGPEETTQADAEWPVAAHYRVEPEPATEERIADERREVAVGPPPWYRPTASTVALAVAVIALLVVAAAAGAWLLTRDDETAPSMTPPSAAPAGGATSSVPPVVGLTVDQARKILDLRGLQATVSGDSAAESARVTSQDPGAGEKARRGSSVSLVVAGAVTTPPVTAAEPPQAGEIAVPSVVGLPVVEAGRKLRAAGLRHDIRLTPSSRAAGAVLAQSPGAGAELERGSTVELEVAKKVVRPSAVRLPNLVGSSAADAKARLRELGMHWTVLAVASAEPKRTVIGQSPAAGIELEKGETVTLRVSSGPALVDVPDVFGLDEQSARAKLENAGFDVTVVDQPATDPAEGGTVIEQDPTAGSNAEKGAVVTITVARSTEPSG